MSIFKKIGINSNSFKQFLFFALVFKKIRKMLGFWCKCEKGRYFCHPCLFLCLVLYLSWITGLCPRALPQGFAPGFCQGLLPASVCVQLFLSVSVSVCFCMFLFVFVCFCLFLLVFLYVFMFVYVCFCMFLSVCVCVCLFLLVCVCGCLCLFLYVSVCVCLCLCVGVCACVCLFLC